MFPQAAWHFEFNDRHFSRGGAINTGLLRATRRYVCAYDTDILIDPAALRLAASLIASGRWPIVIPFNLIFVEVSGARRSKLIDSLDLTGLSTITRLAEVPKHPEITSRVLSGAIMMCDRDLAVMEGGYNRKMVSYGWEDIEFFKRFEKLGYCSYMLKDFNLIHLDHRRGPDSRVNEMYEINKLEFDKVVSMPRSQLRLYVERELHIGPPVDRTHRRRSREMRALRNLLTMRRAAHLANKLATVRRINGTRGFLHRVFRVPQRATSVAAASAIPRALSKLRTFARSLANLGVPQTAFYILQRARNRASEKGRPFMVLSRRARFPLRCRAGTSDLEVFGQMFVQREYRCLDDLCSADLIIDCGANVGFSSAYFLTRYPASSVICVEPDPGNFRALESNLRPYGGRVKALHSAVWSGNAGLVISDMPFGDGREWARTVREARAGESPTISAVDIGTLIRESGHERVSILKIDVEGAEEVIFSSNYGEWIHKVDNLVIELHGRRCEDLFHSAIAGCGYSVSQCDDLTVCKRA